MTAAGDTLDPMQFQPVRKVNSYELIVDQIERGIREGRLEAGDRLPGERRLMEEFSVSRSTVREAMRVLHATGVVDPRPGDPRGPEVLPFSPKVLERPLLRMTQQEGMSRVELIQFRLLLEGQSALLAAARGNEDEVAAVLHQASLLQKLAQAHGQNLLEEFGQRLSAFHEAIRAASDNSLLQACGSAVDTALTELARRRLGDETDAPSRQSRLERSAEDAHALAELIGDSDAAGARRRATENIYRFYRDRLSEDERAALEPLVG